MSRLGAAYRAALHAAAAAAALVLAAAAVIVTGDVLARNLGIASPAWILELSEYALPLATFLIAPWLLLRTEHIRLDILLNALPARGARILAVAADVAGLLVCAVLVLYSVRVTLASARQGALVMKILVFPEWWQYVPMCFCFACLAAEFARRLAVTR